METGLKQKIKSSGISLWKKIHDLSPIYVRLNPAYSWKGKTLLGLFLLFLGLFFFLMPYVKKYSVKNTISTKKVKKNFQQSDKPLVSRAIAQFTVNYKIKGENILLPATQTDSINKPIRILISKLSIDLPITPSGIKDGLWEISETNASWGEGTAGAGEMGNLVIFAHAREGLFGNLINIKQKDQILIFTKNEWFTYEVADIKTVDPNQTEYINPTTDATLTLYTCTGFFDTKRLLVIAKLIK